MRTLPALLTATLVTLAAPSRAHACWDGYAASAGNAHISVDTGEGSPPWTPALVRHVASWLVRIDALLPPGATVDAGPWHDGTVCGAAAADGSCAREIGSFDWNGEMASLFGTVAGLVHASPASRRKARALRVTTWTVQVFAARDEARAGRVADELNERAKRGDDDFTCDEGFISVGGFPSWNDCAHVVDARARNGSPLHRVLVGAFLDEAGARAELASIASHPPLPGLRGFVRTL
jgi:hypothetical protein